MMAMLENKMFCKLFGLHRIICSYIQLGAVDSQGLSYVFLLSFTCRRVFTFVSSSFVYC